MMSSNTVSPRPPIDVPLVSISRILIDKMNLFGNKTFMIEYNTERSFTFAQIKDDCLRMSKVWLELGLKPKQRFGICGHNCYQYMVCLLSGIFVGGIAVPMRGTDTIDEFKRSIKARNISMVALSWDKLVQIKETDQDYYVAMNGIYFGKKSEDNDRTHSASYEELVAKAIPLSEDQIHEPIDPKQEVCLILESSGTTGLPKGCMFSHYNLVALMTIGSLPVMYNRTSDDVVSGHGYTAHISGVNQLIMSIFNGSKLILHPKFEFNSFCAAIEKHKITALSGPASIFLTLLKSGTQYDISSLKKVVVGGAPLPKGSAQQIVGKYSHFEDFRQGYGMTEMTIIIAFNDFGSKNYESVGPPTPGNVIKVIDCEFGQPLAENQIGEICVSGPTLFVGYDSDTKATEEAIDSEGFLHTGDIGYYDSDRNFFIVDRIKSLLKCDGMQVSPTELESIFYTHLAVKEVAVVGKPDHVSCQLPTAFVVVFDSYKDEISETQLLEYVNSRITPLKRIRGGVHFVDTIPKNKGNKVDKNRLLDYFK